MLGQVYESQNDGNKCHDNSINLLLYAIQMKLAGSYRVLCVNPTDSIKKYYCKSAICARVQYGNILQDHFISIFQCEILAWHIIIYMYLLCMDIQIFLCSTEPLFFKIVNQ